MLLWLRIVEEGNEPRPEISTDEIKKWIVPALHITLEIRVQNVALDFESHCAVCRFHDAVKKILKIRSRWFPDRLDGYLDSVILPTRRAQSSSASTIDPKTTLSSPCCLSRCPPPLDCGQNPPTFPVFAEILGRTYNTCSLDISLLYR